MADIKNFIIYCCVGLNPIINIIYLKHIQILIYLLFIYT